MSTLQKRIKSLLIDNFEHTLIAAVNYGGENDNTGVVAGHILGAISYEAITNSLGVIWRCTIRPYKRKMTTNKKEII